MQLTGAQTGIICNWNANLDRRQLANRADIDTYPISDTNEHKTLGITSFNWLFWNADFTALTQVGPTQYIIKTVQSPYNADKIAVLVAGYEAADTTNAAARVLQGVDTTVCTSQVFPIVAAS